METKDRLKELRKQRGLTGQEVAEGCDMAYKVYQAYESGVRNLGVPALMKIAKFYGVTTDYLLGMEPASNPFADMGLDEGGEQEMLTQYMSFPPEVRAVLMDALIKLADSAKPDTHPDIIEETTIGAELDRRAATDAEAQETAG